MIPKTEGTQFVEYIGDGVYASFDGYQIWLEAGDGLTMANKVALEPTVFAQLVSYERRLRAALSPPHRK